VREPALGVDAQQAVARGHLDDERVAVAIEAYAERLLELRAGGGQVDAVFRAAGKEYDLVGAEARSKGQPAVGGHRGEKGRGNAWRGGGIRPKQNRPAASGEKQRTIVRLRWGVRHTRCSRSPPAMSTVAAPASSSSSSVLRILGWGVVAALGAVSVAILAWSRGEPVNALWMVVAALCVFAISYRFHSAWLMAKVLTLDELRATPATVNADGRDFVKTNKWVVFGHHFAAIAGPGPLVGPGAGGAVRLPPGPALDAYRATLGGGVHDSVILFCSTRRRGKSLGQMVARRGRALCRAHRAREHRGDHGDPAGGAGARGGAGAGGEPVGLFTIALTMRSHS